MKISFRILLFLFSVCINVMAGSKNDFKPGYIISLKGDTTKGFVLNQHIKSAFEKCIFKINPDSEPITYYPNDISGYRYIDGEYYLSKDIGNDSISKKVVFIELLVGGATSLYYYADYLMEHYYVEKEPIRITELTEKERIITSEGFVNIENKGYVIPSSFKGKLKFLMQDCPDISKEIQNTVLTHKSLIKIVKTYNEKVVGKSGYEKHDNLNILKFGIVSGYSKNKYLFGTQSHTSLGDNFQFGIVFKLSNFLAFNKQLNLKSGIIFEKDLKPYKIYRNNNTMFTNITYNGVFYRLIDIRYLYDPSTYIPFLKTDIDVVDLKIPVTLNYDFNISKKIVYTCGIGITKKIILSQNKNFQVDEFYKLYKKSINSILAGIVFTTGIEGKWLGKHTFFLNGTYEHLEDFRSRINHYFRLYNSQFSLQAGVYF